MIMTRKAPERSASREARKQNAKKKAKEVSEYLIATRKSVEESSRIDSEASAVNTGMVEPIPIQEPTAQNSEAGNGIPDATPNSGAQPTQLEAAPEKVLVNEEIQKILQANVQIVEFLLNSRRTPSHLERKTILSVLERTKKALA